MPPFLVFKIPESWKEYEDVGFYWTNVKVLNPDYIRYNIVISSVGSLMLYTYQCNLCYPITNVSI